MTSCYIQQYNLTLIDLYSVVDDLIEAPFITACQEHGLLKKPLKFNPDVTKLWYHNFILHICNQIMEVKNGQVVFCLPNKVSESLELRQYIRFRIMVKNIIIAAQRIANILPVTFLATFEYETLDKFCEGIKNNKGEAIDLLKSAINKVSKHKKKPYSLQAAKKFTAKYKLFFLNKEYFDQLKVKSLLSLR